MGVTLKLSIAYTHEIFDRFDYNIYAHWINNPNEFNKTTLHQLQNEHQSSEIINFRYQFNPKAAIQVNYHYIKNPLLWVSSISNKHPHYRFSISYIINL